jgi:hypothetical protein
MDHQSFTKSERDRVAFVSSKMFKVELNSKKIAHSLAIVEAKCQVNGITVLFLGFLA